MGPRDQGRRREQGEHQVMIDSPHVLDVTADKLVSSTA